LITFDLTLDLNRIILHYIDSKKEKKNMKSNKYDITSDWGWQIK